MPPTGTLRRQPQETGLNPQGQKALSDMLQGPTIAAARKGLQDRLTNAQQRLTEVAGDLNDTAAERNSAFRKKSERIESNGEPGDDDQRSHHEGFQRQVDTLTKELDQSVRNLIDIRTWHDGVPDALEHVITRSNAASYQLTPSRQHQRGQNGDDMQVEDNVDDEQPLVRPDPSQTPSLLLREVLSQKEKAWNAKSLTQRYSRNNDYVGFYKTVFDAKNPGENPPPLPHADFWFADEEGRAEEAIRAEIGSGEENQDSELEIASERVRIKCPITFQPFRNPWKSTKCPHSFEKDAIFQMFHESTRYLPWTPAQERELNQIRDRRARARREKEIGTPQVQCPECNVMLLQGDIEPNPVLLRKVKRILEKQRKEKLAAENEESSDDDGPRGTQQRPMGLGSSPPQRTSAGRMKNDKRMASVVPSTQTSSENRVAATRLGTTIELEDMDEGMTDD